MKKRRREEEKSDYEERVEQEDSPELAPQINITKHI